MTEALSENLPLDRQHEIAQKFAELIKDQRGVRRLFLGASGSYPVELYLITGRIKTKTEQKLLGITSAIHELYPPPTKIPIPQNLIRNPLIRVWLLNPQNFEPHFKIEDLIPHSFEEILLKKTKLQSPVSNVR